MLFPYACTIVMSRHCVQEDHWRPNYDLKVQRLLYCFFVLLYIVIARLCVQEDHRRPSSDLKDPKEMELHTPVPPHCVIVVCRRTTGGPITT